MRSKYNYNYVSQYFFLRAFTRILKKTNNIKWLTFIKYSRKLVGIFVEKYYEEIKKFPIKFVFVFVIQKYKIPVILRVNVTKYFRTPWKQLRT